MSYGWRVGLLCGLLLGNAAEADDWPRFRGPDGNGVAAGSPLPVHWDTTRNVLWRAEPPGVGFSSPIASGDTVFVTASLDRGRRRLLHSLDLATGRPRWTRELIDDNPELASSMTGHAAATPATDGRHVVAFFGNAGAACWDIDGRLRWRCRLGEFDSELGLASSPVLWRDRVFLVCDHDGDRFSSFDSFLVALNLKDGTTLWKTERRGQGRSWSTPILVPGREGREELLVCGQDHVRAYDPATGREVWHEEATTGWVAPSPVFGRGLLFVTSGKDGPTVALRLGGMGERVAWKQPRGGSYVPSPLLYGDCLYLITEAGLLTCHDAATGSVHYRERLPGKFTASPLGGGDKVYLLNEDGTTAVLRAGRRFEVLARNVLGGYALASPAVVGRRLLVRTEKYLHCIEEPTR